jgi:hypothetical protein
MSVYHLPVSFDSMFGLVTTACGIEVDADNAPSVKIEYDSLHYVNCARCQARLNRASSRTLKAWASILDDAGHVRLSNLVDQLAD